MIKEFIHRQQFWIFYVLALFIAMGAAFWMFTFAPMDIAQIFDEAQKNLGINHFSVFVPLSLTFKYPLLAPAILFPAAPTVAGLIMIWYTTRKKGLHLFFSRFKPWRDGVERKDALKTYGIILAGALAYLGILLAYNAFIAGGEAFQISLANLRVDAPLLMVFFFVLAAFFDCGGLLEEGGWRGYALPYLQGKMKTPLAAAVLLGILWGVWHFPRDIPYITSYGEYFVQQLNFILGTTLHTIILAYFFNRLGGSLIPVIVIHGLSNYIGDMIGHNHTIFLQFDVLNLLKLVIVLVIIWLAGAGLGLRKCLQEQP